MPTIPGVPGPYRFFFYSFDCNEPKHVHARREKATCKLWLEPLALASNHGFGAKELNAIRNIVQAHKEQMIHAWTEHCGQT